MVSRKKHIIGLGRTGMSVARHLRAQGISFAVTDSRLAPPELESLKAMAPDVVVRTGAFDQSLLNDVNEVVVSPGVSLREPILVEAARRNLAIVGDIELFARATQTPVVGITGTNGKSTVTTLVALMAQACGRRAFAGGNLGRPALDLLQESPADLFVLELSSFQLETIHSLKTKASTVLNVTSDHMDRYESMLDYAQAKARIFDRCDCAVINQDDPLVMAMPRNRQCTVTFSVRHNDADYSTMQTANEIVLVSHGRPLVNMTQLKLAGLHNVANALAALAICDALQLDMKLCLQALKEFPGLPHRAQWVADIKGVRYIEDSKGTNVGATLAAVQGMSGPLIVIAGGQGKGQDFAPLAPAFRNKVRCAVLLGQDAPQLNTVLKDVCATTFVSSMEEAVTTAANLAQQGDTVLLSPACASLDMFRDYAHRGDVFVQAVKGLSA